MEYNTERNQLLMPEYGRHIQQLVEHCKSLPTKEERNEMAKAIVEYPFPTREELAQKPKKMEYPKLQGDYKFYGKSILQLIEKAIELEEGDEKEALIEVIANNMKKSYNVYNKEHVQDEVIFRHLKELSENRLDLTSIDSLEKSRIYHSNNKNKNQNQKNNPKKRFNNHNKNRKR